MILLRLWKNEGLRYEGIPWFMDGDCRTRFKTFQNRCRFWKRILYNSREQAVKWCGKFKRRGKQGIVTTYEFDESTSSSLKILSFDSYSEEWLDFILKCRRKQDSSDYDIVMGGVANDKVFNTVELYFDHLIDKQEAIKRLRYEKPNMQICFRSERALKQLHFEGSFEV